MEGNYNSVYAFIIYLVLDLYREIKNISLFYNFTEVL